MPSFTYSSAGAPSVDTDASGYYYTRVAAGTKLAIPLPLLRDAHAWSVYVRLEPGPRRLGHHLPNLAGSYQQHESEASSWALVGGLHELMRMHPSAVPSAACTQLVRSRLPNRGGAETGARHMQLALHSCTQRHAAYLSGSRAAAWTAYERQSAPSRAERQGAPAASSSIHSQQHSQPAASSSSIHSHAATKAGGGGGSGGGSGGGVGGGGGGGGGDGGVSEAAAARKRLLQSAAVLKLQQAQRLRASPKKPSRTAHYGAMLKRRAQHGASSASSLPSSAAAAAERPPTRPTRRQLSPSKSGLRGLGARRAERTPAGYDAACDLLFSPGLHLASSLPYEIEVEIGRSPEAQPWPAPSRAPAPAPASAEAPCQAPSTNHENQGLRRGESRDESRGESRGENPGLRRGQLRTPLTIEPPPGAHYGAASPAEDESLALEAALITALGASGEAALCDIDCCAPRLMMRVRMRVPPITAPDGGASSDSTGGGGAFHGRWTDPVSSSSSSSSIGDTWTRWSEPVELLPVQRDHAHDDAPTGARAAPSAADETAPSAAVGAGVSAGVSAGASAVVSATAFEGVNPSAQNDASWWPWRRATPTTTPSAAATATSTASAANRAVAAVGMGNGAPASAQHGASLGVEEAAEEAEEAAGEAAVAARSAALLELACEAVALESGFIEDGDVAIALHSQAAIALPLPNSLRSEATGTALWLQLRRRVNVHGTLMLQLVAHKLMVNQSGLDLALRFEGVPAHVLASGYELPTTASRCSWSDHEAATPLLLPPATKVYVAVLGESHTPVHTPVHTFVHTPMAASRRPLTTHWSEAIDLFGVGHLGELRCRAHDGAPSGATSAVSSAHHGAEYQLGVRAHDGVAAHRSARASLIASFIFVDCLPHLR